EECWPPANLETFATAIQQLAPTSQGLCILTHNEWWEYQGGPTTTRFFLSAFWITLESPRRTALCRTVIRSSSTRRRDSSGLSRYKTAKKRTALQSATCWPRTSTPRPPTLLCIATARM